jgi:hypothetical protein
MSKSGAYKIGLDGSCLQLVDLLALVVEIEFSVSTILF